MCHRDDRPLNDQLVSLIKEARRHDPKSNDPKVRYQRRRALNCLVTLMQRSGKLWRGGGSIEPGDLAEAESRTWVYLFKDLDAYKPDESGLIHWYNTTLKYRLLDVYKEKTADMRRFISPALDEEGQPMFDLAASPECPNILGHIHRWLEENRAEFEAIHLRDRPHINCYGLIRARLPDQDIAWKDLAVQLDAKLSSLSGFYQNQCWSRLQAFGEKHGYLDPDQ